MAMPATLHGRPELPGAGELGLEAQGTRAAHLMGLSS